MTIHASCTIPHRVGKCAASPNLTVMRLKYYSPCSATGKISLSRIEREIIKQERNTYTKSVSDNEECKTTQDVGGWHP